MKEVSVSGSLCLAQRAASLVAIIVSCLSAIPIVDGYSQYTDSWAVRVIGGRSVADEVAARHGFINAGQVSGQRARCDTRGAW